MDHSDNDFFELLSKQPVRTKSPKELGSIVRYLFQNPQDIANKFIRKQQSQQKENIKLDSTLLVKLYENINNLNLNQVVGESIKCTFDQLQKKQSFDQFVKRKENIRYFFVVMFWEKLYTEERYVLLLLTLANFISRIGSLSSVFVTWCNDISQEFIRKQVDCLLEGLELRINKMKSAESENQISFAIINLNILNLCEFLAILYQSNKKVPRILDQHFKLKNLAMYFQPLDIFKVYLNQGKFCNFVKFPFLLQLDFKYKLLQIESVYEQKISMQKNVHNGLRNLLNGQIQLDVNGNFTIESMAYLHFQINRNNILDDSLEKLGKVKYNLKNPLRIQFLGEEGADQGGVQNQYFQILTKQIFNPYLDMFLSKNNSRVYWFNGFSFQPPIRFQFVGMLLGLAIYNSVHLDVRFPKILYKKLLSSSQVQLDVHELMQQVNEIEPDYYRSFKQIMDSHQPLDSLCLFFNIDVENFGEKITYELVDDGNNIPLTQDNKEFYVYQMCDFLVNRGIEKQFKAFKKGFDRVVDTDLIRIFTAEELEVIICGKEVIDFKELEANTAYEGYTKQSPVIRNLWTILNQMSITDKKAFLMFCTGSDRVPLGGLKSLKFVVQRHSNQTHLPTAHTCFNVLLLPEYPTLGQLRKNIEFILKNNQGFGLI